jgi:hypothetical protein
MKKLIFTIGMFVCLNANAQWVSKKVDNGFDPAYRICYNDSKEDKSFMCKLENVDGEIAFYLANGYFCEDDMKVDISFMVNGEYQKYFATGTRSTDNSCLFLIDDMRVDVTLTDFKKASMMKIRVNDPVCGEQIFTFSMSGSTAAMNFIMYK